jgi:hypothetical protein
MSFKVIDRSALTVRRAAGDTMAKDTSLPDTGVYDETFVEGAGNQIATDIKPSSNDPRKASAQVAQALETAHPTHLSAPGRKPLFRS